MALSLKWANIVEQCGNLSAFVVVFFPPLSLMGNKNENFV